MEDKLERFRAALEAAQVAEMARLYPRLDPPKVRIILGPKYARVDVAGSSVSWSGKYMVELATGAIYGIKGYGVIHRGYKFGTLDTINAWDWSGYRAVPARATVEVMP